MKERAVNKSGKQGGTRRKRRGRLSEAAAQKFLAAYQEAWETRNAELAASLFTRDAHYWENPFGDAIVGREAIASYWKAATDNQEDIHFRARDFHLDGYTLLAEWVCSYRHRPSGERRELAGILLAEFYGHQVRTFREYWHRRVV